MLSSFTKVEKNKKSFWKALDFLQVLWYYIYNCVRALCAIVSAFRTVLCVAPHECS